jgi:hypothetical protein
VRLLARTLVGGAAVAVGLAGVGAVAQGPVDGAIRGHVAEVCGTEAQRCDASGVRIHLTSADLGVERDVDADSEGDFLMLRLPPGEYQVRATSQRADKGTVVATFDLEGGDLDDVVLTLGAPHGHAVESEQAAGQGLRLASFAVQGREGALPIESREWENLAQLDSEVNEEPSVTQGGDDTSDDEGDSGSRASASDGAAATGLSYAGLPATQGTFSLDGLSGEQSFRAGPRGSATGGASSGSSYAQGSVRSFRMLPRNFSAQYGMVGGMAVVTRAASAQLHGTAFFLARESAWATTNPYSIETHYRDGVVTSGPVKPKGSLLQFGGSAGGPLWGKRGGGSRGRRRISRYERAMGGREPVSMFASLEVLLHDDKIVSTPELANFYDLSADQIALLANRGVSAGATNAALDYLDSLTGTTTRHAYVLHWIARQPLKRSWFFEERNGNCRLMADLATQLAETTSTWARLVAPFAEWAMREIASTTRTRRSISPTRLTQNHRRDSKGETFRPEPTTPVRQPNMCNVCGSEIGRRQKRCGVCALVPSTERLTAVAAKGLIASHTPEAQAKRSKKHHALHTARREWSASDQPAWLTEEFYVTKMKPKLVSQSSRGIARDLNVSLRYATEIRHGRVPHPRHWGRLANLLSLPSVASSQR